MKLMFHWNKTNCKQEKENSCRAWKEAFTYKIILSTKSQSQGDQVITKYQDKTKRLYNKCCINDSSILSIMSCVMPVWQLL